MFPRGPCEAGDIIEERWALLNSQAYYQFFLSPSDIHLHLSLSPHHWLIVFLSRLIWPCTPPPPPLPSTSLPQSQEETKEVNTCYCPPPLTTPSTHPPACLQVAFAVCPSAECQTLAWVTRLLCCRLASAPPSLFLENSFHQKHKDNANL